MMSKYFFPCTVGSIAQIELQFLFFFALVSILKVQSMHISSKKNVLAKYVQL